MVVQASVVAVAVECHAVEAVMAVAEAVVIAAVKAVEDADNNHSYITYKFIQTQSGSCSFEESNCRF